MSDFKPGEKVRSKFADAEYEIVFGPYGSEDTYACLNSDGVGIARHAYYLEPIPPSDPRVDVVAKALYEHNNRHAPHTRQFDGVGFQSRYLDSARAILAALDAMPKEKPSPRRVRDSDGDVWEESDDGTWIGVTFVPADMFGSYRELAGRYGPLTPIA